METKEKWLIQGHSLSQWQSFIHTQLAWSQRLYTYHWFYCFLSFFFLKPSKLCTFVNTFFSQQNFSWVFFLFFLTWIFCFSSFLGISFPLSLQISLMKIVIWETQIARSVHNQSETSGHVVPWYHFCSFSLRFPWIAFSNLCKFFIAKKWKKRGKGTLYYRPKREPLWGKLYI